VCWSGRRRPRRYCWRRWVVPRPRTRRRLPYRRGGLGSLVTAIRQLNIEVPAAVDAEVELYRELPKARETAQSDYAAAVLNLRAVEPAQFDAAKAAVVDTSMNVFALMQGVDAVLIDTAARRLTDQVYDATPDWESAVVDRFNDTI
jgi:hypothetical protein